MVGVLAAILAATGLITFAFGDEPDYAHLVPAPDAIIWTEGDESPLWVSTNRESVDVRVSSIDLGVGEIDLRNPSSSLPVPLGQGLGCLDSVVKGIQVDETSATAADLTVTLDSRVSGQVTVYYRTYLGDSVLHPTRNSAVDAALATATIGTLSGLTQESTYRVIVSTDERFPVAITRSLTWTQGEADTYSSHMHDEEVHLLADTGVSLLACGEGVDIAVTLHGDGGEELNRYLVDVLPAPTPTTPPARYETRRVCVDSNQAATSTPDYLSGGELVGDAFDAADFGLSGTVTYSLGNVVEGSGHVFFFVWGTSGQIKVSAAGAADVQGLDADRVYQVRVTATDVYGASAYKDVGVWLDISDPDGLSPSGDGLCS